MSEINKNKSKPQEKLQSEKLKTRRKAVRAIVLGGGAVTGAKGLPSEWSAPLINSVVLPAHAATTDDSGSSGDDVTTTPEATTTPVATTTPQCSPGYYYWNDYCYSYPQPV